MRPQGWVRVQRRARFGTAVRQAFEANEGGIGQGLGETLGQSCFSATERADNVVERLDVVQLE